jgi:hypothetical protein
MRARQIFVLAGAGPLWEVIIRRLERVNARVLILEMSTAEEAIERLRPDLIIAGEEEHEALSFQARHGVRLVVSESLAAGQVLRGREGRQVINLGWPTEEEDFVALTRRLLSVPERRVHRTVIHITARKKTAPVPGESIDFSLTGVAFATEADLKPREEVAVAFGEEAPEKRLCLTVNLVRSAPVPDSGATLYAGRFIGLTQSERHSLERFVWGIR